MRLLGSQQLRHFEDPRAVLHRLRTPTGRACGGGHAEGEGHRTSPRSASALASCAYVIGYEATAMRGRGRGKGSGVGSMKRSVVPASPAAASPRPARRPAPPDAAAHAPPPALRTPVIGSGMYVCMYVCERWRRSTDLVLHVHDHAAVLGQQPLERIRQLPMSGEVGTG